MNERDYLIKTFRDIMGCSPDAMAFAPGRVNLIGEHIDYNGGHVLPCALTLGIYGAMRRREDGKTRMLSLDFPEDGIDGGIHGEIYGGIDDGIDAGIIEAKFSEIDKLKNNKYNSWTKYVLGVVWAFREQGFDVSGGFDFVCYGNLPTKAGLSSSAALEVLVGTLLSKVFGVGIYANPSMLSLLAQRAENDYVGMNCGIMDQFASANGKEDCALFLNCRTLDCRYVPLNLSGYQILIINTNKPHELVNSAFNKRRSECEEALENLKSCFTNITALCELTPDELSKNLSAIKGEAQKKRAIHAVTEEARTVAAFDALKRGDLSSFGLLMKESHASLRDNYQVSCPELDYLIELTSGMEGVLGSKMTGGGFGGCTVNIVREDSIATIKKRVGDLYFSKFGYEASFYTAEAGDGAHFLL